MSEVKPLTIYKEFIDYIREKAVKAGLMGADLSFEPNSKKCAEVLNKCSLLYKNGSFIKMSEVCTLQLMHTGTIEDIGLFIILHETDAVIYFTKEGKVATKGKVVVTCQGDIQLKDDCSELFLSKYYSGRHDPFTGTINFGGVDTSKARSLKCMFCGCKAKHLDLSSFDNSNAIDIEYIFGNCNTLETVDMSSFDTSKASDIERLTMFGGCTALKHVYLPSNGSCDNIIPLLKSKGIVYTLK